LGMVCRASAGDANAKQFPKAMAESSPKNIFLPTLNFSWSLGRMSVLFFGTLYRCGVFAVRNFATGWLGMTCKLVADNRGKNH
jgi:hypothetical protein